MGGSAHAPSPVVGMERLAGKGGWREYRQTGGRRRWAIDREWVRNGDGRWRKRGHHRRDLPPLTEEQYEIWKAMRADARSRSGRRNPADAGQIREVIIG